MPKTKEELAVEKWEEYGGDIPERGAFLDGFNAGWAECHRHLVRLVEQQPPAKQVTQITAEQLGILLPEEPTYPDSAYPDYRRDGMDAEGEPTDG